MVVKGKTIQVLKIEKENSRYFIRLSKQKISVFKNEISQYFDTNGYLSWSVNKKKYIMLGTNTPKNGLVPCPQCRIGQLLVIRSHATKKRFIGCSNYYNGCKASSPLIQKAVLRTTKKKCEFCMWPIILFRYNRKQKWIRRCANIKCNNKKPKY